MAFVIGRVRSDPVGAPERHFLGWDRPVVESAADEIGHRYHGSSPGVDLTGVHVIVPGSRFGVHLVSHLARRYGAVLGEPLTIERFLERALPPVGPTASDWVRRCVYLAAAADLTDEQRARLWPPAVAGSFAARLAVAASIDSAATRLAGEGYSFSDVLSVVRSQGIPDVERWIVLDRLRTAYLERLRHRGLADPSARRLAQLEQGPVVECEVVLACLPEVPGLLRRVIDLSRKPVLCLIGAPPELGEVFDHLGAILPEAWRGREAPIDDAMIRVVEGPDEQAEQALLRIGQGEPSLRPADAVIAAPDDQVQHAIERLCEELSPPSDQQERAPIRVRAASGVPGDRTSPGRFLRLVGDFLSDPELPAFVALVRHHAVERRVRAAWLGEQPRQPGASRDALAILDDYATAHVHGLIDGRWLGAGDRYRAALDAIYHAVAGLLGEFWEQDRPSPARAVSRWAKPIVDLLHRAFDADPEEASSQSCGHVEGLACQWRDSRAIGEDDPEVPPAVAIGIAVEALSRAAIHGPRDEDAVEVVGWLEAVHDPAPILVLTGMNEGSVPRAADDGLLPDSLRAAMGLATRDSALARDAFLLTQAIAWRASAGRRSGGPPPGVLIIAARRKADGTRQWPSRLLIPRDDAAAVARLSRFLPSHSAGETASAADHGESALVPARVTDPVPGSRPPFEEMPLADHLPIRSVSVTGFTAYMRSPYLFYLEKVLRLQEVENEAYEMDAKEFGTFLHRVLERFARSSAANLDGERTIADHVKMYLEQVAREVAGSHPPTAVAVQIEQAAYRLENFASFQADRVRQGWSIVRTEWSPDRPVTIDVGGTPLRLTGRIDRIDHNPRTNEIALLDYKTKEDMAREVKGMYSEKRSPYRWADLQMPLYRVLAAEVIEEFKPSAIRLGYISLPKTGIIELHQGGWPDEAIAEGLEQARVLAADMLNGVWRVRGTSIPEAGVVPALCGVSVVLPRSGGRHVP